MKNKYHAIIAIAIAVIGLILFSMDVIGMTIHMRGVDSIAGAILLGLGVLALREK